MRGYTTGSLETFYRFSGFSRGWQLGLLLILIFSIPRFVLVLHAAQSGNYRWVSLIFVAMAVTPLIILRKDGRREAGIKRPSNLMWLWLGFAGGMVLCYLAFVSAGLLFGTGSENWLVYISGSYMSLPPLNDQNRLMLFFIFSVIGMTFSPVGEELFYRGLVHENFRMFGEWKASLVDSGAFALVHLAHFGIVYTADGFTLLILPSLFWCSSMYLCCLWFGYAKRRSGSITGAIMAHAGFNLMMNYLIFYRILN